MAESMGRRRRNPRRALCLAAAVLAAAAFIAHMPALAAVPSPAGRVIRVPQDHRLISLAVAAARAGDVVEVDDGYYFETNVVLDKPIAIRSKNLFGAVVCGSQEPRTSVFIVRAAVDISGFVLKDSTFGLLQRESPDVEWTGSDLAFLNFQSAVSVDDRLVRVGSALLSRIIIDRCQNGISTNEANHVSAERCFISRTDFAFAGSNHVSFWADKVVLWDCQMPARSDDHLSVPVGGSNRIDVGPDIWSASSLDPKAKRRELPRRLNRLFAPDPGQPPESADRIRRRESLLLALMGRAFLDSGDLAGAESHFRHSLALMESGDGLEARWQSVLGLAQTAEKKGDAVGTIDRYEQAIDFIESVGSRLPLSDHRTRFRKDKIGIYETVIGLLLDRSAGGHAEYDRRAFLLTERSKAQGFQGNLRRAGTDLEGLSRNDGRRELGRLSSNVSRIQTELQNPDTPPAARSALNRRLEKAEAERQSFFLRVRQRDPSGTPVAPPPVPSIEDIRRELLDESTALLEYVLGEERSYAFLLTREGLRTAEIPNEGVLRPRISNYLRFLTLQEPREFAGWAGGRLLRESLLGPFENRLAQGIRRILVIPDGLLHYLPFETMLGGPDGRRFLIQDYTIDYGPSASALIDLKRRPAPTGYPMEFLGLADDLPYRYFSLSAGGELLFPSLPFAKREVRSIGRMFPAAKRTILTGREAGESRLKSLPLADYRVVHLATHGFFDDAVWWRSALLLHGEKDGREDGFLQPGDLFSLRFRPELLVLSGCRTGGGRLLKGEGVMGLSGAFLRCGARSILFSLWNVNDKATARFMASFYRLWTRGTSKPEALRRAKVEAIRSGEPPFVWAPFVLIGN